MKPEQPEQTHSPAPIEAPCHQCDRLVAALEEIAGAITLVANVIEAAEVNR